MDTDPSSSQTSLPSSLPSQPVNSAVNGAEDGSDDDGFLSGEEDFETASDRPFVQEAPRTDGGEDDDSPFENSAEFFTAKKKPLAAEDSVDPTGDDDNEAFGGVPNGGVLRDVNLELDDDEEESGIGGGGEHEVFVEAYGAGDSDSDSDKGFENGDKGYVLNNDDGVSRDGNREVDDGVVDIRDSGDSLVEAVQVDLLASGVAVVGDEKEVEESEIKGLEGPVAGVSVENEFDPIQRDAEEAFDKLVNGDAEPDRNVGAGADEDGAGHAEKEKESGIAVMEKDGNLEVVSDTVKAVEDDKNIEDRDGEGESENLADASGDSLASEHVNPNSSLGIAATLGEEDEDKNHTRYGVIDDGEENEVKQDVVKDEEVVMEVNDGVSHGRQHDGDAGVVDTRGGGDPLVEALQVDLLASGVAVVGDKEDVEESEIKGLEGEGVAGGVSVENKFDPIGQEAEEAFDKLVNGDVECDKNGDIGADEDGAGHAEKGQEGGIAVIEKDGNLEIAPETVKVVQEDRNIEVHDDEGRTGSHVEASGDSLAPEDVNPISSLGKAAMPVEVDEDKDEDYHHNGVIDGSVSDGEGEDMIFGSSEAARQFLEMLEKQAGIGSQSGANHSQDLSQRIDGQIVTDSEDEADSNDEGEGNQLFDSTALAALLKAGMGNGQDGGGITITSKDGSRLFSIERPAGLGPSLLPSKPPTGLSCANLLTSSDSRVSTNSDINLSAEEKKKLEKLQQISIRFLRLVHRLGFTSEETIAARVLYRLALLAGRQTGQIFSIDAAKESARQLEEEGKGDLDCSLNMLVLGKTGVGKSATINSILGEMKTTIGAYGPATTAVTEIVGMVDGVKIKILDTPGLKSSALEQSFNRKVLSTVKKLIKKSPPDIVLYVDRLDTQTSNLNDLPMLRSISTGLGPSIWRNAVVALTHCASDPPDGPSGSPLSYDVFVAQRTHLVQQTIGQAIGDMSVMSPHPVALVENHCSCPKNRDGEKVLPNGQSWRPFLLLLCHSMKILAEVGNLSKVQESFDPRKLFGFRVRAPPLPYLLSWLLQSRTHPKLPADQGGIDNGDSDIEMADLSDSDLDEDEDEYDQLLPFKPLKKSQVAKLSREQRKAYFEEYDYRVKLLQKQQWKGELKRMREMKKKGKADVTDHGYMEEDDQDGTPATVPVPLPDMALPPSFDSDNPAYRYRFLEPTSQLLTRPVLDTHSWDHDCGYDGVNLEHSLAIVNKFPAAVAVQISKDKKDFSIHLDSSVAAKHGENVSSMAGFDIQNIGKQLAYIIRGETKLKNFKRNKTGAGVSVTFLGEHVSTGLKVEDQIALGKRLVLVGTAGMVRSQGDSAYGTNLEVRLREADFPIGQDQSSLGLSLVKWRGDLALGANFQSQFSVGRSYKMAVRAGLNNKLSGQISVRTSSSDQLQIALLAILPVARAIYKNFWLKASDNYPVYY